MFDGVIGWLTSIWESLQALPGLIIDGIVDGLKKLFIPSDGFLDGKLEDLANSFYIKFGVEPFDISDVFGAEMEIKDIEGDYSAGGLNYSGKFIDFRFLYRGVETFRPAIRGLIGLFIILFHFRQFFNFIGAGSVSSAGHIGGVLVGKEGSDS